MTNEDIILQKINEFETHLKPILDSRAKTEELKKDLTPLMNHGIGVLITEMLEVESSFELQDMFDLIKQTLRSTKNLKYCLKQLDNIIEFIKDMEPLLKSAVPILIGYLDDLEKRGVFRIIKATLDIRAKVAAAYDHEDIDRIGDGMVALLGFAKHLAEPKTSEFVGKLLSVPSNVNLDEVKGVGPTGLISAGFNKDIKNGLGVVLELTKALGKVKAA